MLDADALRLPVGVAPDDDAAVQAWDDEDGDRLIESVLYFGTRRQLQTPKSRRNSLRWQREERRS